MYLRTCKIGSKNSVYLFQPSCQVTTKTILWIEKKIKSLNKEFITSSAIFSNLHRILVS